MGRRLFKERRPALQLPVSHTTVGYASAFERAAPGATSQQGIGGGVAGIANCLLQISDWLGEKTERSNDSESIKSQD